MEAKSNDDDNNNNNDDDNNHKSSRGAPPHGPPEKRFRGAPAGLLPRQVRHLLEKRRGAHPSSA
eukprot:1966159-Alexandrium_andersonii.AAC.1